MPNITSQVSDGNCGNGSTDQYIVISWKEESAPNTLSLTFGTDGKKYFLKEIVADLSTKIVPSAANQNSTKFYHVANVYETPKDRSFHCTRVQSWNLTNTEVNGTRVGSIDLSHVLMQAYLTEQNKGFSQSIDCDAMNTPGKRKTFTI